MGQRRTPSEELEFGNCLRNKVEKCNKDMKNLLRATPKDKNNKALDVLRRDLRSAEWKYNQWLFDDTWPHPSKPSPQWLDANGGSSVLLITTVAGICLSVGVALVSIFRRT